MRVLIVVEGLQQAGEEAWLENLSRLSQLASRGVLGEVDFTHPQRMPEAGSACYSLFKKPLPDPKGDIPAGYYGALAAGLNPDPNLLWAQLSFTHLKQNRDQLLFVSPERTGQTPQECKQLVLEVKDLLGEQAWRVEGQKGCQTFLSHPPGLEVKTWPVSGLDSRAVFDCLPQGKDGPPLHHFLLTSQMVLHRHPLNTQRNKEHRLTLNSPWIWGVGTPAEEPMAAAGNSQKKCWSSEHLFAGMAAELGYEAELLESSEEPLEVLVDQLKAFSQQGGQSAIVHLTSPAVLARHGQGERRKARLREIDQKLLAPLLDSATPSALVVTGLYTLSEDGAGLVGPVSWVGGEGKVLGRRGRFWDKWFGRSAHKVLCNKSFYKWWIA